jgi:hypothetical protein
VAGFILGLCMRELKRHPFMAALVKDSKPATLAASESEVMPNKNPSRLVQDGFYCYCN